MCGNGKKSPPPKQDNEKSREPKSEPVEDYDDEEGDIAAPRNDDCGDDDEPL
jgi:hypothetical protein